MPAQSPAQEIFRKLQANPAFVQSLNAGDQIAVAVQQAANEVDASWQKDVLLYRIAVGVLGGLALITALGALGLTFADKETPGALVSLGSAAVGALVGLFAPSPSR